MSPRDMSRHLRRTDVTEQCIGLSRQSALMLAARITLPHFSVSSAMSFAKSAGEPGSASPRSAKTDLHLGVSEGRVHLLLSLSIMTAVSLFHRRHPSAPPILTTCNGDGALGCNRVPGDAA